MRTEEEHNPDPTPSAAAASDTPIRSLSEDRMGRQAFARALAAEIMDAPVARGYVMGITGAWGSGKTSILNMTVDALGDAAAVVEFNPWMFSGTEALVASFFAEIGKQLDKKEAKLKGIAGKLATYGQYLSPIAAVVGAGTAVQGVTSLLQELSAAPSVLDQHRELRTLLEGLDKRVVVVIDDVDRLRPHEVLDIVRLVRLVGDFPNTLYLLAFDRRRVEQCLGEGDDERGRAYLEKIVQVTHNVPSARQPDVAEIFIAGLVPLIDTLRAGPFNASDWQNIFTFVIRPLLVTPRHVQRLLGSLPMTMRLVGDEVAAADLVGIEAVRVLHPALFEAVVGVAEHLSAPSIVSERIGYQTGRSPEDSPLAPMFDAAPSLAADVCRWLFPGAQHYFENKHYGSEWEVIWRQERKIASSSVFRFYLERQLPDGVVPAAAVDEVLAHLDDPAELDRLLEPWAPDELMDLLERLNPAIEKLPLHDDPTTDPARVALPVILDALPRLPEARAALTPRGSLTVMRVAVRLLRRIPDEAVRTNVVRAVIDDTRTLSGRDVLLAVVGHQKNVGSGLVAAADAAELEDRLRNDLIALSPADFAIQDRVARLAAFMAEIDKGRSALRAIVEDDRALLALLADSVSETRTQSMGAAAVEVTTVLPWGTFAAWFGEETLVRRVGALRAALHATGMDVTGPEQAALDLAAQYASGDPPLSSWERLERDHARSAPTAAVSAGDVDPELATASTQVEPDGDQGG